MRQPETDFSAEEGEQLQALENPALIEPGSRSLSDQLTDRQLSVLPHLLKPGTLTSKAKTAGIGRATLYRWLEDDGFRASLQLLRQASFEVAQSELQAMAYDAAALLRKALNSKDMSLGLQAVRIILDQGTHAQHSYQVQQRVDILEEAISLKEHAAPRW